jgi:hypothetical protein|tara:strand:+ start:1176 stop:1400 length:225 start_codon:yes stop_codon:yes gene_type:complete
MSYLKVEGHRTLVRETSSNAIVNTDRNAYTIYMNRIREARKSNDDLKNACREINSLKSELKEIKELLVKVTNGS